MSFKPTSFLTVLLVSGLTCALAVADDEQTDEPKIWALLVAGSHGYDNYRHQADICHAYQVLHNHGIPDERIVVMMYDDIANNPENPTPGVIINNPDETNLYPGVPKDYTEKLVTAQNFLDILQGKTVNGGSGKVIASGPHDHVFINFVGEGGTAVLLFPDRVLHAQEFSNVIQEMRRKNMFSKMVIYLDAAYSGSMFENILSNNMNVYATTSTNPYEPASACYPDDLRHTYLGDAYSVRWMENSDLEDLRKGTLVDQFKLVQKETITSHVMQFGNLSIGRLPLSQFQGASYAQPIEPPATPCHPVSSRDVPIAILRRKMGKASSPEALLDIWHKLKVALQKRSFLDNKVAEIVGRIPRNNQERTGTPHNINQRLTKFYCYERAVRHFSAKCFDLSKNPYGLRYLHVFANLCKSNIFLSTILDAMDFACKFITIDEIV